MDDLGKQICRCIVGACDETCRHYDAEKSCCVGYEEVVQQAEKAFAGYENYKDLEKQGRLLKLPYALNDTVYYLDDFTPLEEMPIEGRISGFRVTWCGIIVIHITTNFNDEGCLADRNEDIDVVVKDFGKTVFLTREEAEAALKEWRADWSCGEKYEKVK